MTGERADARADAEAQSRLIQAVSRRVGWARENLAGDEFTDLEKNWMRRYEIDVPALVAEIERLQDEVLRPEGASQGSDGGPPPRGTRECLGD